MYTKQKWKDSSKVRLFFVTSRKKTGVRNVVVLVALKLGEVVHDDETSMTCRLFHFFV